MGQALYRKYRSKKLSEIVGQEHITTVLANALKSGKINHAYLFTGPKGVGKTSIARILAHEVNGLEYREEANHLDIIEIDAASNRRIDEVRDLRDKVHIAPTSAKYKVYIIDEVHMLTREAFNALLKTLEEPPEHVIFVLATTEAHKLPETIISRTQRFSFKPIADEAAVKHLKTIAKKEGIAVSEEALKLIAEHSEGSFRDSIGILEQAGNSGEQLDADAVRRLLGIAPAESIERLRAALTSESPGQLVQLLSDLRQQGLTAANLAKQLSQQLRDELINQRSILPAHEVTNLLESLLSVPTSQSPDQLLEIVLLRTVLDGQNANTAAAASPEIKNSSPAKASNSRLSGARTEDLASPLDQSRPTGLAKRSTAATKSSAKGNFVVTTWPKILEDLKQNHSTLYGVLRMCRPAFANETLVLSFRFAFHQKQINDSANQQKLEAIIARHHSGNVSIEAVIDGSKDPDQGSAPKDESTSLPPLDTITNIFGGGEVLES